MKKSKHIVLLLVTASVFSQFCAENRTQDRLYMRADTNVKYSSYHSYPHSYVHFYPYGVYNNGLYQRTGYYNSRTYKVSTQSPKSNISKGGMGRIGRGGFTVST